MLKQSKILILPILLILGACASTPQTAPMHNPTGSFQVKVWIERAQPLKVGDLAQIRVRSDRACYLYVYYLAGSGAIRQIFPDNVRSTNQIQPGVVYQIPPPGASYQFQLTPPPGREKIAAIATLTPVRFFDQTDMDYASVIPQVKLDETAWRHKINAALDSLPAATWSADEVFFTYGP